jgi:hypothetical protein
MNENHITTSGFSNPKSQQAYQDAFKDDPSLFKRVVEDCEQCGGCAFFAPFNPDFGLCCNEESKHWLETVFEHFGCHQTVQQGWGGHSFKHYKKP